MLTLPPNSTEILVMGTNNVVFTSLQRIDTLFRGGYRFEAAIAQGTIVDALMLCLLLLHRDAGNQVTDKGKPNDLTGQTPTMGVVLRLAEENKVIADRQMLDKLGRFVVQRNAIVHTMAASLMPDELDAAFENGRELILGLRAILEPLVPAPAAQQA